MSVPARSAETIEEKPREKQPRKSSRFEAGDFVFEQGIEQRNWQLRYHYKKCNGCGLCVDVCPTGCMTLGNVPEIASGLDAPAVLIDGDDCCFCGMCAGLCPLRALDFRVDGEDARRLERYPRLAGKVDVNEKCLPCLLCAGACPTESIRLELEMPEKEKLAPFRPNAPRGRIDVDREKCTLCGLCAKFCPALLLLERKPCGPDQRPFEGMAVDETKCDWCGLCVPLCPEDAIAVEGDPVEGEVEWSGKLTVNDDTCIRCGRCQAVCPYDAIRTEKFFRGRVDLVRSLLAKCDPTGCQACFDSCPTDAWYVPAEGKLAVNEAVCNYCGGCQEACRYLVIDVRRDRVETTPLQDVPWRDQWTRALGAVTGGERGLPPPPRVAVAAEAKPTAGVEEAVPVRPVAPSQARRRVKEALRRVEELMGKVKVRFLWERDEEKAGEELARRMENKKNGGRRGDRCSEAESRGKASKWLDKKLQ